MSSNGCEGFVWGRDSCALPLQFAPPSLFPNATYSPATALHHSRALLDMKVRARDGQADGGDDDGLLQLDSDVVASAAAGSLLSSSSSASAPAVCWQPPPLPRSPPEGWWAVRMRQVGRTEWMHGCMEWMHACMEWMHGRMERMHGCMGGCMHGRMEWMHGRMGGCMRAFVHGVEAWAHGVDAWMHVHVGACMVPCVYACMHGPYACGAWACCIRACSPLLTSGCWVIRIRQADIDVLGSLGCEGDDEQRLGLLQEALDAKVCG